jgi:hypothetical protein
MVQTNVSIDRTTQESAQVARVQSSNSSRRDRKKARRILKRRYPEEYTMMRNLFIVNSMGKNSARAPSLRRNKRKRTLSKTLIIQAVMRKL